MILKFREDTFSGICSSNILAKFSFALFPAWADYFLGQIHNYTFPGIFLSDYVGAGI